MTKASDRSDPAVSVPSMGAGIAVAETISVEGMAPVDGDLLNDETNPEESLGHSHDGGPETTSVPRVALRSLKRLAGESVDNTRRREPAPAWRDGDVRTTIPGKRRTLGAQRFSLVGFLGRGGMGEVHKAWDEQLRRYVALKLLRGGSPELQAHLIREAQAQARVEHEHVRKVYGVGEMEGQTFISLQYINGKTLRDTYRDMRLRERLEVMIQVAEGLHAAHRMGLIHRDVKPGNVLVERIDDAWKAYVTDFGTAWEMESSMTGVIAGTPQYMAPEQAKVGGRCDRRTDVYGLGATLYELLCGRAPFDGSPLSIMQRVINEAPRSMRAIEPTVPSDLDKIVRRSMEKEPESRYETARAFAEDLRRYLDGEPVQAERPSFFYRLGKLTRKHVALISVGALAVGLGGWAYEARRLAAEEVRQAQHYGREVERFDAIMRQSAMMPLHDTRRERALVAEQVGLIELALPDLGSVAKGPARYALGRGYLTLGQVDRARVHLQRAWDDGLRTPEVGYALGRVLGELYQRELREAQRTDQAPLRVERMRDAATRLREPALKYLRMAGEAGSDDPDYGEALVAFYDRRYGDALRLAEQVRARRPWMYELARLQGEIHVVMARQSRLASDLSTARREYELASQGFAAATLIAPSDAATRDHECQRLSEVLSLDDNDAGVSSAAFAACGLALKADPNSIAALASTADVHLHLGKQAHSRGADPREPLKKAIAIADNIVVLAPLTVAAHMTVAMAHYELAYYEWEGGRDPVTHFEQALQSARRAVELEPSSVESHVRLAAILSARGSYETELGQDPQVALHDSIEQAGKARALAPNLALTSNAAGLAELRLAEYDAFRGRDARAQYRRALRSFEEVTRLAPEQVSGPYNACITWASLANHEAERGEDPGASLRQSLASCQRAQTLSPADVSLWIVEIECLEAQVRWEMTNGRDGRVELAAAMALLEKRQKAAPTRELSIVECRLATLAGRMEAAHHRSPRASFERAQAAIDKALQDAGRDAIALEAAAELHRWRADGQLHGGKLEPATLRAGRSATEVALRSNPRNARLLALDAVLILFEARLAPVERRATLLSQAGQEFERAFDINPLLRREFAALAEEAGSHRRVGRSGAEEWQ